MKLERDALAAKAEEVRTREQTIAERERLLETRSSMAEPSGDQSLSPPSRRGRKRRRCDASTMTVNPPDDDTASMKKEASSSPNLTAAVHTQAPNSPLDRSVSDSPYAATDAPSPQDAKSETPESEESEDETVKAVRSRAGVEAFRKMLLAKKNGSAPPTPELAPCPPPSGLPNMGAFSPPTRPVLAALPNPPKPSFHSGSATPPYRIPQCGPASAAVDSASHLAVKHWLGPLEVSLYDNPPIKP